MLQYCCKCSSGLVMNVLRFSRHQYRKQFQTLLQEIRRHSGARQPLLFRTQGRYFVLGDRTPIPVTDASCFTEAVEFLFFTFFCFQCAISAWTQIFLLLSWRHSEPASITAKQQCTGRLSSEALAIFPTGKFRVTVIGITLGNTSGLNILNITLLWKTEIQLLASRNELAAVRWLLMLLYTVFQKSDAKIQITITTAYLVRIKYPLSGFN